MQNLQTKVRTLLIGPRMFDLGQIHRRHSVRANIPVSSFSSGVPESVERLHCPIFLLQIDAKKAQLSAAKRELKSAKADAKVRRDEKSKK